MTRQSRVGDTILTNGVFPAFSGSLVNGIARLRGGTTALRRNNSRYLFCVRATLCSTWYIATGNGHEKVLHWVNHSPRTSWFILPRMCTGSQPAIAFPVHYRPYRLNACLSSQRRHSRFASLPFTNIGEFHWVRQRRRGNGMPSRPTNKARGGFRHEMYSLHTMVATRCRHSVSPCEYKYRNVPGRPTGGKDVSLFHR